MTKQKDRIDSVRKEKLLDNFEQFGISAEFVENFTIRLSKPLSGYGDRDLQATIIKSLKSQIKKHMQTIQTFDEFKAFLESVSFGSSKITFTSIEEMEDLAEANYLLDLLYSCAKLRSGDLKNPSDDSYSKFEKMAHLLPVELKVIRTSGDGEQREFNGYSLGGVSFTKRIHGSSWYLTRQKSKGSKMIYDVASLVSGIFFTNSIEQFTLKNIEFYEYKGALKYIEDTDSFYQREKAFPLPSNGVFKDKLLNIMDKFELLDEDVPTIETEQFNELEKFFEVKTNEEKTAILNMGEHMRATMTREFVKQASYIKEKVDREMKNASDYARSFQTKKHINKQTLEVMNNNKFLTKYGYVEIDNDVNLEKFSVLEKEFEELGQKIYVPKSDDHSFRIKKLGHHKAAGLYYPAPIRATIFDLDSPDAYCHELGHQLDYSLGKGNLLSEGIRFRKIADLYETLVVKTINELSDGDSYKNVWQGKTKYNASYYLQPTEIFARSFEIYLWKKGIETSFLKKNYDAPVYPTDEKFIKSITKYFDDLFSIFKVDETKKETKAIHVASPKAPVIRERENEISMDTSFEQLSLF